ncbi:MAG TPA: hypothetical protein VIM60_05910, partial [Edaphobacter sp.]
PPTNPKKPNHLPQNQKPPTNSNQSRKLFLAKKKRIWPRETPGPYPLQNQHFEGKPNKIKTSPNQVQT